jgi:glycosyltransferase involved in cell wall biosynthesis
MKQLTYFDYIFPISHASSADSQDFLAKYADRSYEVGRILPVLLPGEFFEHPRVTTYQEPLSSTIRIPCVSTIEPRKNHLILLEAFNSICKQKSINGKLILIGQQLSWTQLEKKNQNLCYNNTRINWIRNSDDNVLAKEYEKCHFTVYASIEEGFGLPILESLWFGRPCICRNNSGMLDAAEGGGCLTVDTSNADELARAMLMLIENKEMRANLGGEAVTRHIKTWHEYAMEIFYYLSKKIEH